MLQGREQARKLTEGSRKDRKLESEEKAGARIKCWILERGEKAGKPRIG